jgi:NAD(P)-dependent dehydrogenase (short-subunit alcohol dehydrogenase family)
MKIFDLTGKLAIVTGATKGIGRGIAEVLCAQGARVAVSSRTPSDCEATVLELCDRYGVGMAFSAPADVGVLSDIDAMVDRVRENGPIDILVCNAARMPIIEPPGAAPEEEFMAQYNVNVEKVLRLVQRITPEMVSRRDGSIILIGSRAGMAPAPQQLAYSCAKSALHHLTRNLAAYYASYGVRINCVAPGLIRSDASRLVWEDSDALKSFTDYIPLKRMGEAEEIGGAVAFLASAASGYVTGTILPVDGGVVSLPNPPGHHGVQFSSANVPPAGAEGGD